ncbi:hypothetical protein AB3S75_045140 [Citrus x aurantiifolia]
MLSVELALSRGKEDLAQIIAVCWVVWHERNLSVLEGNQNSPQITAARATTIVESYRRIKQPKNLAMLTQRQLENKNWKLPQKNWFKVNVDAVVKMSDLEAGLGVVIRDSSGKIVSAAVLRIRFRGNVACMEAEAVLFGIQAAYQAKYVPFIIESD